MDGLRDLLWEGVGAGIFSGAQAGVFVRGQGARVVCAGHTAWAAHAAGPVEAVSEATRYDLASLTKLLVTAPLVWRALTEGVLRPDMAASRWLPDWEAGARAGVTVRQLLSHSAGLPAWRRYYEEAAAGGAEGIAGRARALVLGTALEAAPGSRACYSDPGYMLLGLLLERALGAPLDELARALIFSPLEMAGCRFVRHLEGEALAGAVAQTEVTALGALGASPVGQVHDENAWALGGVAGHAGLFGGVGDALRFAEAILAAEGGAPPGWGISGAVVRWACSASAAVLGPEGSPLGSHLGGVDSPSGEASTAGASATRAPLGATVGHLGFTGTSLWIDRARGAAVALLSNRVHPSRAPEGMRGFRVRFHEAAWGEAPSPRRLWPAAPALSGGRGAPQVLLAARGERELEVAVEAALEAGALARSFLRRGAALEVRHKGAVDLVTQADLACEAAILARLRGAFPSYGVLAEESGAQEQGDARWIVDPIDGTTNFSHGVPHYCVCVALEVEGQLQLGVIYDPARDELFSARRGGGAWCNGRRLRVSSPPSLGRALAVTGFPYDRQVAEDNNAAQVALMLRHAQGIRRFGAAGLDLAWVAAGRLDVYWELRLKPWDMAAGLVLVEEAGGRITAPDGGPVRLSVGDLLASGGGAAHEEAAALLARFA